MSSISGNSSLHQRQGSDFSIGDFSVRSSTSLGIDIKNIFDTTQVKPTTLKHQIFQFDSDDDRKMLARNAPASSFEKWQKVKKLIIRVESEKNSAKQDRIVLVEDPENPKQIIKQVKLYHRNSRKRKAEYPDEIKTPVDSIPNLTMQTYKDNPNFIIKTNIMFFSEASGMNHFKDFIKKNFDEYPEDILRLFRQENPNSKFYHEVYNLDPTSGFQKMTDKEIIKFIKVQKPENRKLPKDK